MFDHCLLLHPEQIARIESKLPAYTVGSLQRKSQMDVLLEFITSLLEFPDPGDKLKELGELISGSRYFCESLFWASQPKQAAKT
ncbi:hypothetical protein [Bathymodiolus japonicus methanotrophic gill symbiont]|uniref:hypothetical protein n=1 Tax=Bathymodiolus japonicus methanotrophic gill symbiont TaxID=113269 RepID=UPI001C8D5942|nr:hypothetical protein [Bathymodiolus japonicus methanotrophic gill symbiont]